jgi:O-antigen ligase
VLDSEMLGRLVDTGVLGVLALALMLVCIVLTARPLIRQRDPRWSPIALMVACSAVAYLVLTFLFDVSSFPHVPYILFALAGLLAVVASSEDEPVPEPPRAAYHVTPDTSPAREREALALVSG